MVLPVLDDLLAKEMDRRQFLANIGMAILALIGVTAVLKRLNDTDQTTGSARPAHGSYGGGRKTNSLN